MFNMLTLRELGQRPISSDTHNAQMDTNSIFFTDAYKAHTIHRPTQCPGGLQHPCLKRAGLIRTQSSSVIKFGYSSLSYLPCFCSFLLPIPSSPLPKHHLQQSTPSTLQSSPLITSNQPMWQFSSQTFSSDAWLGQQISMLKPLPHVSFLSFLELGLRTKVFTWSQVDYCANMDQFMGYANCHNFPLEYLA